MNKRDLSIEFFNSSKKQKEDLDDLNISISSWFLDEASEINEITSLESFSDDPLFCSTQRSENQAKFNWSSVFTDEATIIISSSETTLLERRVEANNQSNDCTIDLDEVIKCLENLASFIHKIRSI